MATFLFLQVVSVNVGLPVFPNVSLIVQSKSTPPHFRQKYSFKGLLNYIDQSKVTGPKYFASIFIPEQNIAHSVLSFV